MSRGEQLNPHILVFPYPAQGHILPLLDLTHQLALRNLTTTILVTPKNLQTLTPLLSAHPTTIHTLVLPFPPHPAIPAGVENVRDIGNHGNIPTINALSNLRGPILRWLHSHPNPPAAVIADHFLGWAAGLGLPFISFSSSNAFSAALADDCWLRLRAPAPPPAVVRLPDLPGSPEFPYDCLPSILRRCRESDPETDLATESLLAGISPAAIVVINTFEALEEKYLSHLRKRGGGGGRVFAVGPVSLLGEAAAAAESRRRSGLSPEVAKWLDGCDEGSVLYVCFGSQKVLDGQQTEALASGLERSGVRFLWAVKTGGAGVPDGFEERVEGRGLVMRGWAPQVELLGHVAVGGFLSHCGWNSALEGVAAGVRILAWPMEAEQHVNARLLAEDLGVAVRVGEGAEWVPHPDELARKITVAMARDSPVKARAEELRDKALAAVTEGGTSFDQLDEFVRVLRELQNPCSANFDFSQLVAHFLH